MKHYVVLLLAALSFGLCSCTKVQLEERPTATNSVRVELQVLPEAAESITRATDENRIADVNLFLFGKSNPACIHLYGSTSRLCFECPAGEYALYAIANIHADMGDLSESSLLAYEVPFASNRSDLPMAAAKTVRIEPSAGTITLPAIEVKRQVAKVACCISVDSAAGDIHLQSVCCYNVPHRTTLFDESSPSSASADYCSAYYTDIPADCISTYEATFYLPENRQGTVPSITDQRQKDCDHAPRYATYLLIRATRGDRILDYKVYLGENNTSDFNLRCNTFHTMNIVVRNDTEVDTRVNSYTLSISDTFEQNALNGWCLPGEYDVTVDVAGNSAGLGFEYEIEVTSGDGDCILFDRWYADTYFSSQLFDNQGENRIAFEYAPVIVTADNSLLEYEFRIWDDYGFEQSRRFSHRFANEVQARCANGKGTVQAAGALTSEPFSDRRGVRAFCYDTGCTFTAVPDDGYRFAGWYADSSLTQLLSSEADYSFLPSTVVSSIYAAFEQTHESVVIEADPFSTEFVCNNGYEEVDMGVFVVPYGSECELTEIENPYLFEGWYDGHDVASRKLISHDNPYTFRATEDKTFIPAYRPSTNLSNRGTANCYIVSQSGANYHFAATVMGNGRGTTGITPKSLKGVRAEVIWESSFEQEFQRGAVIREVAASGGWICFVTGSDEGNAVIGLFDAGDNCIWSWHIWVTSYDPAKSLHTYRGGKVFMDRNLGAAAEGDSGMFYQWGRKDPFSASPSSVLYHPDYGYDTTDPTMGYGEMTIAYAVAHPWAFMDHILLEDDREDDTNDWLATQNPNLWGNKSSATRWSGESSKSIYDPCPVGWKVPDHMGFKEAPYGIFSTYDSYYMTWTSADGPKACYPRGGYLMSGAHYNPDRAALVWTNAPAYYNGLTYYKHNATALKISASGIESQARYTRDKALPVRCVKE